VCGIIGIASKESIKETDWITIGRDAMSHRGPDDAGVWFSTDKKVILGHRRLSIIDLTADGHQPMVCRNRSLTIVFNGEIYNYRELREQLKSKGFSFLSNTDTEVILHAYKEWGTACVKRLQGMFAFAVFDSISNKLFLARDRAGEKPLFYHYFDGVFRFSSELKGMLADSNLTRRIDHEALNYYLKIGYVPGDKCILKGFNKLKAAHTLEFDLNIGVIKTKCYWNLSDFNVKTKELSKEEDDNLIDELDVLLENSVRKQMVADVPVGILLSGGVDSSLITAMASRSSAELRTYTVSFPSNAEFDETEHSRMIAKYFGTTHTELSANEITTDIIYQLVHQFDEPLIDSSMIPTYLVSQLVSQECKVALGGDGGDELFGGYMHHSRLLKMKKIINKIPMAVRNPISVVAEHLLPLGYKGRNWLQALKKDLNYDVPLIATYFDDIYRKKIMSPLELENKISAADIDYLVPNNNDLLQRTTRMDYKNYLTEDILVKVDRASMLNSLEMRSPLLDQTMVEFAFGKVPSRLKANHVHRKILLKQLAKKILPNNFDVRRKQGFSIPLNLWLKKGRFRELFNDVLSNHTSIFNRKEVQNLFHGQDRGYNNAERLFGLVMFELWRCEYAVEL
jgi:asparagine synthase (glutamine-hydrolysing)